ncbi:hypothetical protein DMN91_006034 [Ooceraea biroi]|uniref:Uncharacterized protein n=1 Tax=Ooceraea biroi TaxID=2015173 RepID=A0A3L8DP56_OOCBI|nr:hypothetical protein DMN91_006034 [Ooceraea biroi]
MNESPPVIIRLGVNKVDFNLGVPTDESIQPRLYTPGEEVNKLISVRPLKARYNGEIGDLIVGRITEVQQKRWKVDINSKLDAVLLLSSVNLPGGELRRRSAEDEQTMRKYLQEKDLICAEVQSIFADGSLSLHTRVLKYGRLSQGMMLKVPSMLIQRTKTHYHTLENGATLILGCNGYVWIGASTQHVDKAEGGFTEDLSKLPLETYKVCIRLRNCILCLVQCNVLLSDISVTFAYEESAKYELHELLEPEAMIDVSLLTHQRLARSV